jgi:hypothetical protein
MPKNETPAQNLRALKKRTARRPNRDTNPHYDRVNQIRTPRSSRSRSRSNRTGHKNIGKSCANRGRTIEFNLVLAP